MNQAVPTDVTNNPAIQAPIQGQPAQPADTAAAPQVNAEQAEKDKVRLADLARQQKAIRQQQKMIQEQRKAIEDERRKLQEEMNGYKQKLAKDPYGVMLEQGLTADQAAAILLQQPNPEDQKYSLLQQELKQIKDAQEQYKLELKKAEDQRYENAKNQIHLEVKSLIESDDSYETIKSMNASEAVVALIEETFQAEGKLMTIEEAAKDVEDYLVEEAMKITQLKKIKSKFNPAPESEDKPQAMESKRTGITTTAQTSPVHDPNQGIKTLSNRLADTVSRPLTAKERRERAILAFQGKL